ncbi:PLP-dependent cysteine synthase family protein [Shouchella miscanthi]|uniref:Cysteine synthase family protein n=1 Tax=Shouchella miscanthi TaxID=2598861 RepID=A0ABU6NSF3_9BACI|nr:cysteine synthase family protein [Shouchella miscanthi]MED4130534.1 cysteine synthase family protein [Shouchella miscanthi]
MDVHFHIHELIGKTPIVELRSFPIPQNVRLFAKLESYNPGGSIKDRLGKQLLYAALESKKISPKGTIIEPTAGNTGIALALAAIGTEVNVIAVVPTSFSLEKQQLIRGLGATVINTPSEEGIKGAIKKAQELEATISDSYCPLQFQNPENPLTYYKTLGPELYAQLNGQIDVFLAGAGSCGTFQGTAAYLKEQNPDIDTVVVQPEGSILDGGTIGPHRTEGIGMEFIPHYVVPSLFDRIHTIPDDRAFLRVRELAKQEGILVGSSSGAVFEAALKEAREATTPKNIVMIFADGSDRYLSKGIYEEDTI